MTKYPMIINGECCYSDREILLVNPSSGDVFSKISIATDDQVDKAISSSKNAFEIWSKKSSKELSDYINMLADIIEKNSDELIKLVSTETGKPKVGLSGVGATMEVMGAVMWLRYTAEISLSDETIQDNEEARVVVRRKPLGVVASITPWNWPFLICIWHISSALRAGNTVIIKPSEFASASIAKLVELANEVLPKGVLNLITGDGDVGSQLVQSKDISKIVFTGSTNTGKSIMRSSSDTLKRLVLELGGNDPAIVMPESDLEKYAMRVFSSAFHNNGQTCACIKRLYVHSSQYDEFIYKLANIANSVKVGDSLHSSTELGPLQNEKQLTLIENIVQDSVDSGGIVHAGGYRPTNKKGFFYMPTIISGLNNYSTLVAQEQFGPVLPVLKYDSIDEAINMANDNLSGLGASVWGDDSVLAEKISSHLECGTVWINGHGEVQPDAPFGGIKESGFGVEFGKYGLEECTYIQTLKIHKV